MLKTITKLSKMVNFNQAQVVTDLKSYQDLVAEINTIHLETKSAGTLQKQAAELRLQALEGASFDELLVKAYALVREVSRRLLGLRPFNVQLMAAIAIHQGKIVEMLTGEGKTLAAVLPAYLNALTGKGVHILTFNDYLAKRDAQWMGPIYDFLGLKVDYIQSNMNNLERQKAYSSDITYVTAKEAGFDHLRAFLCYDPADLIQRPFHFAIVDEADSILIDEGRIPLVIAGNRHVEDRKETSFAALIPGLQSGTDYEVDEDKRNVVLTEHGVEQIEKQLGCGNLYASKNLALLTMVNHALHAEVLLKKDVDYIIQDNQVKLVDEFTGRVAENRHWPDGLQEAIEAKEGLERRSGGQIFGSITMRHFLNSYPKIAGMTGTAQAAADHFKEFYNLDVVVIPPNRPNIRIDYPDLVFGNREQKYNALIQEINQVHSTGRPVLIGTQSIRESEQLAKLIDQTRIPYQLLNAKNDELEAGIIAQAGKLGAVTISTNMAGRGTDIRLGGIQESSVRANEEYEKVKALGGLYVVGTNHFESSRIDNQLRGRAGRQGDPGSSRFYISLEDELIVSYRVKGLIPSKYHRLKQVEPILDPVVNRQIVNALKMIEIQNYEIQRNLWKYAWIVEKQRRIIQNRRQDILLNRDPLGLFQNAWPDRFRVLAQQFGAELLTKVEKQVTLYFYDKLWAEFLEEVAQIQEGIHLVSLSGKVPLLEFHKLVDNRFADLTQKIQQAITSKLGMIEITADGVNLEKEGLRGPSATWTYLINDTPFGGKGELILGLLFRNLLKKDS